MKPWLKEQWCIPPKANADFVACMEDVLGVYTRPYDARHPQVCMDETSKQLVSETRTPLPMQPGEPERYDYEYERQGVCNVFLACEPLAGKRFVKITAQRTKVDWAHFIRDLVDVHYPTAEKIVLVQDNLNTHTPAALYEAFPRQRPVGWSRSWRFTTLPSTEAGSTWLRSSSPCSARIA